MEIYPTNTKDYTYLHKCGADYVTVFQETYNSDKYETLHLAGLNESSRTASILRNGLFSAACAASASQPS